MGIEEQMGTAEVDKVGEVMSIRTSDEPGKWDFSDDYDDCNEKRLEAIQDEADLKRKLAEIEANTRIEIAKNGSGVAKVEAEAKRDQDKAEAQVELERMRHSFQLDNNRQEAEEKKLEFEVLTEQRKHQSKTSRTIVRWTFVFSTLLIMFALSIKYPEGVQRLLSIIKDACVLHIQ